jgi:ATP-binding cassette subfamily B protein
MSKNSNQTMTNMNDKVKNIPFDDVDHKTVILTKDQVKQRNEATNDYSKVLNTRVGRGPGGGVYLGKKAKNRKAVISRIWNYLGNYKYGLIIIVIAIFLTSLLSIYIPTLLAQTIDAIEVADFDIAITYAFYIMGIAAIYSVIRYISRFIMVNVSQKTVKKIRGDAFNKLQKLPVRYYDQNQPGDISSRITNDVDLISNSLNQVVTELVSSVITLVGSAVMMFLLNWMLAIVVLLFVPLMIYITMQVAKRTRAGFTAQQKHLGGLNSIVEESISGLRILKLYGQEKDTINEFKIKNIKLRDAGFKANVWGGIIMPLIGFINNVIYLVLIILGGILAITGIIPISIGDIAGITTYARNFVRPIQSLSQMFNTIQQGLAGAERVFNLMDEMDEYVNDGSLEVEHLKGDVEFRNVTFGYDQGVTVLEDISFCAKEGKTIAIVGPTGSGKTTIINLMNRFYDVDSGSILIDDVEINQYKKDQLRKKIGVVLQDTKLFAGTVYENIVYGNHNATQEEIEEAATLANAHDFITRLPKGYESEVQEGGQNFSHGERQLISIARTILSNPDILILDEATSNVDTRTEFRIQKSMKTLMEGRTSFVIAHRLQTIRNAHKILVIKDGKLIEEGSHQVLLKEKGFYYDLYTTQFKDLVIE